MKKELTPHFEPWGKNNRQRLLQDLSCDPKMILERILEDCEKPDKRENAVSPEALRDFKPAIEEALKLYEAGEYKKLAWVMFGLGLQTEYFNYWPVIREGSTRVKSYHRAGETFSVIAAQDENSKKNRILKQAPELLKTYSRSEVIEILHERLDCSKRHVRDTIKNL